MAQNVLIVDDTETNLILFSALVKKLDDCVAHPFMSALQGLLWAADNEPDLVIVDYMMPEIDGLEFIRRLREIPACEGVPVVMITANDQKQLRHREQRTSLLTIMLQEASTRMKSYSYGQMPCQMHRFAVESSS